MREHLIVRGICPGYTTGTRHDASKYIPSLSQREKVNEYMDDRMDDMIYDIGLKHFQRAHAYDTLYRQKRRSVLIWDNGGS